MRHKFRPGAVLGAAAGIALLALTAACSNSANSNSSGNGLPPAPYGTYGGQGSDQGEQGGRTGFAPEVDPREQADSAFAIDIDTASYTYARRQLLDGSRVDPATVRPEEFVNAFRQDYREPSGDGIGITADGSRLPSTHHLGDDYRLLRVGLQTRGEDPAERQDAALTFVIDVSGSMAEPGRLDLVKDALHYLIDQLRPTDQVAIVAYDEKAWVVCDMTPVRNRDALHNAVDDLDPGSSTNLEAGLVTGYRVARDGFVAGASNRVILLSDGLANTGDTNADDIVAEIRAEAAKQITLLGVGVGSEYGDALMERLADEGDGFVTYVSEKSQARKLFVDKLPATLAVRARDAKVQVSFDPSTVAAYRLVGYDDRVIAPEDFRDDHVDGGEVGPGHSVTAVYLVRLADGASGHVADVRVRWLDPESRVPSENVVSVTANDLSGAFAAASPRLRVDYAAAFFAEVLRESPYAEQVRLPDLAAIAESAADQTEDSLVDELAQLIRLTTD